MCRLIAFEGLFLLNIDAGKSLLFSALQAFIEAVGFSFSMFAAAGGVKSQAVFISGPAPENTSCASGG
ncbi:MAG: hypothetical protein AB1767_08355 [Bacillota bacterium]